MWLHYSVVIILVVKKSFVIYFSKLYKNTPLHWRTILRSFGIEGSVASITTFSRVNVPHTKKTSREMNWTTLDPPTAIIVSAFLMNIDLKLHSSFTISIWTEHTWETQSKCTTGWHWLHEKSWPERKNHRFYPPFPKFGFLFLFNQLRKILFNYFIEPTKMWNQKFWRSMNCIWDWNC